MSKVAKNGRFQECVSQGLVKFLDFFVVDRMTIGVTRPRVS
ncbi:MAG: hypothetical protein WBF90_13300 [Rivularia sp. (in: cyanobacteria)]